MATVLGRLLRPTVVPAATAVAASVDAVAARSSPQRTPLVCIHGLFGSHKNLTLFGRFACEQLGYTVHMVDVRNHGSAPHAPEMDYRTLSNDLLRYLDEAGLEEAHLFGFSMGGKIACAAALTEADRIRSIIVGDIAPVTYRMDNWDIPDIVATLKRLDLSRYAKKSEVDQALRPAIPNDSVRTFLLTNIVQNDPQNPSALSWRMNLEGISNALPDISAFPFDPASAQYPKRALFVRGEESPLLAPKYNDQVLRFFPRVQFETVPRAGHWIHNDQPEVFHRLARTFLASVEPRQIADK